MIIGLLSDTHADKAGAIPHVVEQFRRHQVDIIVHCGDIEPIHLDADLFGNFPVICALTEGQRHDKEFCFSPNGWRFTKPEDRVVTLPNGLRFYVGHKRAFDFLMGSGSKLKETMDFIRRDFDSVEWMFSGHTHHQIFFKQDSMIQFVNPGAIANAFDGHEYAIIDTELKRTTFSRIPKVAPARKPFSIGVVSDSLNISDLDPDFWTKLAGQFRERHVTHVVHCGNIALNDIGHEALSKFTVYCHLRDDQESPADIPANWNLISDHQPVVTIEGYQFYVKHDLGVSIVHQSEADMFNLSLEKKRRYPEVSFILFGSSNYAFLEEGEHARMINPGDVARSRSFVVITLPTTEIEFGAISTPL